MSGQVSLFWPLFILIFIGWGWTIVRDYKRALLELTARHDKYVLRIKEVEEERIRLIRLAQQDQSLWPSVKKFLSVITFDEMVESDRPVEWFWEEFIGGEA